MKTQYNQSLSHLKRIDSLGVPLRAEPSDLSLAIYPLVRVFLAGQSRDRSLFAVWIVGLDIPIIVCDPNDPEANFCFCHRALCIRLIENESTDVRAYNESESHAASGSGIEIHA